MTIFDSPLLTAEQVSEALSIPVQTLANMRHLGTGPKFIRLPNRKIRYFLTDVQEWVMGQPSWTSETVEAH